MSVLKGIRLVLWLLVTVALAMTAYYLGLLVLAQELFNGVCGIFWTIGRAMLNGYTLYEDIFETKPPLIFVMSGVSLKLFGNQSLGYILHTILLFAVPAGLAWYAARRTSGRQLPAFAEATVGRPALLLLAFLFGTLLVRYLSRHPTGWAIEFYGIAFSMLYLMLLSDSKDISWKRIGLLTLCLIGAIGMKESFLLVILSGALIVASSRSQWVRGVLVPIVITAAIGLVTLAALGSLHAYLTVYLPEMFGYYVQRFYIPFILKGLVFDKVLENIALFSWPFLVFLLVAFVFPLFSGKSEEEQSLVWTWIFRIFLMLCIAVLSATSFLFRTTQGFLVIVALFALYRLFIAKVDSARGFYWSAAAGALLMVSIRYICYVIRFFGSVFTGSEIDVSVCVAPPAVTLTLIAMLIPVLIAAVAALHIPEEKKDRPLALSLAGVLLSCLIFYFLILLQIQIPFLWTRIVFPLFVAFVVWQWWKHRHEREGNILQGLGLRFAAFFVISYAISMGSDYQGHHFLSVIPFLLAVFLPVIDLLGARSPDEGGKRLTSMWLAGVCLVVILNPLHHPALDNLPAALAQSREQVQHLQSTAAAVDRLLDACTVDRYLVIRTNDFPSFTRHTPNNYFLWAGLEAVRHHSVVSDRTLLSVVTADIIIIGDTLPPPGEQSPEEAGTLKYITQHFTDQPRDCAAGISLPKDISVYYRFDTVGTGKLNFR